MSRFVQIKLSPGSRALVAALAVILGGVAGAPQRAVAQESSASPPPTAAPITLKGDAAHGRILASTCSGCHGIVGYMNAYPEYNIPKLGGQNGAYITVALQDYRRKSRSYPTMQAQAATLTDQDIADIAAYFTSVEHEPMTGISDATQAQIARGKKKSVACAACHGANGIASSPQWPNLAGQHASYLRRALHEYKSGGRQDLIMGPMVSTLSDQDIADIAAYFAAQPGLFTIQGM